MNLLERVRPFCDFEITDETLAVRAIELHRSRCRTLVELAEAVRVYFVDPPYPPSKSKFGRNTARG